MPSAIEKKLRELAGAADNVLVDDPPRVGVKPTDICALLDALDVMREGLKRIHGIEHDMPNDYKNCRVENYERACDAIRKVINEALAQADKLLGGG